MVHVLTVKISVAYMVKKFPSFHGKNGSEKPTIQSHADPDAFSPHPQIAFF
jgi:hypothetical protein